MIKTVHSLLLVLAIGACGGSAGMDSEAAAPVAAGNGLTFVIDNSRSAASSLRIFLVPEGVGARIRLGDVRLGETKTLTPDRIIGSTRLRLIGQETGGRELISRAFTVTRGSIVEWDVARNRIYMSRVRGDGGWIVTGRSGDGI